MSGEGGEAPVVVGADEEVPELGAVPEFKLAPELLQEVRGRAPFDESAVSAAACLCTGSWAAARGGSDPTPAHAHGHPQTSQGQMTTSLWSNAMT